MSKECKTARNVVMSAIMILAALILVMSMSGCGSTGEMKACCERTSHEIYKYEGLIVE